MSPPRMILTGLGVMAGSLLLVFSPLLLGANVVSKTVVAFGLLTFLAGASFVMHGVWDRFTR